MRVPILAALLALAAAAQAAPVIDRLHREVRFTATVQPEAMERPFGVRGHHAIVWRGGRSKRWALFVSDASNHEVRLALDALGARAGENLTPDSWNRRDDPASSAPDRRVEGTAVSVLVEWRGSNGRVPLAQLLRESGGPPHLDFRYGGNERWQPEFRSGCIVCLYSCPGGAIGNRARTIRDWTRDGAVYRARPERLPRAGTKVTIILKVEES